ncbi:D-alanyl-D-alanine carboxypeptidase family protein [Bacillus aquiflavi]|uniref:D-alanyl-D-alanine carboxypeptidase family protein n=1 Tax=Bacillus aquiflavi TaxID=2672567 RepID=UPI00374280FA
MESAKKISIKIMVLFLIFTIVFSTSPQYIKAETDSLGIEAEGAILLDAETGKIFYEKNADAVIGVASMSKMMTEYLVLEAINEGKIKWDQEVIINEYIHQLSAAPELSNIGLTQGEKYTVKELYQAMAIHSGNAATVALAELISGTKKNFVKLMNKKGEELGLGEFKFVNSSGLNNRSLLGKHPAGEPDEENVMSAKATAKLAFCLLRDFPEVLETAKMPKLKFKDGREYANFNWMLPGLVFHYEGVDGLKTGSTDFAGFGFTSTAERDGQRFITVVMKANSKEQRFTETRKLLDYGFSNFSKEEILPKNYVIKGNKTIPVIKGKEDKVKIHTKKAVNLVVNDGEKENYTYQLVIDEKKLNKNGELTAPVKKGDKIGYLIIEPKDGEQLSFLMDEGSNAIKVDVVAAETVEKANWFVLTMRGIGSFFGELWDSISSTVKGWF